MSCPYFFEFLLLLPPVTSCLVRFSRSSLQRSAGRCGRRSKRTMRPNRLTVQRLLAGETPALRWGRAPTEISVSLFSPFSGPSPSSFGHARRACGARPYRGEFASKRTRCPTAMAYLAYLARKSYQMANFRVSNFEWSERKGPTARVFGLRRAEKLTFSATGRAGIVPPFQGLSMVGACTQGDTRSARFALGYHLPPFQG